MRKRFSPILHPTLLLVFSRPSGTFCLPLGGSFLILNLELPRQTLNLKLRSMTGRAGMYFLVGALLFFAGAGFARAQEAAPEYKFKAAYLYHFAQLVVWPPEGFSGPTGPLTIAVMGQSPFGDELERILRGT